MNPPQDATFSTPGPRWLPWAFALIWFLALVLPAILLGYNHTPAAVDQNVWHIPQTNHFIEHPSHVFSYPAKSATTPGHHLFLALTAKLYGYSAIDEHTVLVRLINALFGIGLLVLALKITARLSGSMWRALTFTLPLACSMYVLSGAIWIVTDDGALFFYALLLYFFLFHENAAWKAGLAAACLVFWRQIYLPVAGAMVFKDIRLVVSPPLEGGGRGRARAASKLLLAIVPAAIVVAAFVASWGGFQPPEFREFNRMTFHAAVPLHALALFGLLSVLWLPLLASSLTGFSRKTLTLAALGSSVVVLSLWLMGPSLYNMEAGRWGSIIWSLAGRLPSWNERSLLLIVLALFGAVVFVLLFAEAIRRKYYPVELIMLALYFLAYSAQVQAWQRYIEPHILLTLAVTAARQETPGKFRFAGPLVLAAGLLALSLGRVYGVVPQISN